jgi:hypothetical protein
LAGDGVTVAVDSDFRDVAEFAFDLDAVQTDGVFGGADGQSEALVFYVTVKG